jgi:tRNA(Ile)-lysidine synthase
LGASFESAVAAGLGAWPRETIFLAAVSGGADSTAMLAALAVLRESRSWHLHCLHVDHGIRPREERRGDAEAVEQFCKSLDLPFRLISLPPGMVAEAAKNQGIGVEGAARKFRHAAWKQEARRIGADRVLVAHTRDDLIETLLMRFLKGAGPAGLAALPRERGGILRPLLALGRAEVLRYLAERGIPFRIDSSNGDTSFFRNRLRLKLIPLLDEWFPHWRTGALHAAETQRLTADFLADRAREEVPWERMGASPVSGLVFSAEEFFSRPEILREEALFQAIDRLALDPGRRPVDAPDPPAGAGKAHKDPPPPRRAALRLFSRHRLPALDLGSLRVECRDARVRVQKKRLPWEKGFSLLIKEPGLYTLEWFSIACTGHPREGGGGFFAELPLVLRRSWNDDYDGDRLNIGRLSGTDIISALDRRGPAAFIGMKGGKLTVLPWGEKDGMIPSGAFFFYLIAGKETFSGGEPSKNTGGKDV